MSRVKSIGRAAEGGSCAITASERTSHGATEITEELSPRSHGDHREDCAPAEARPAGAAEALPGDSEAGPQGAIMHAATHASAHSHGLARQLRSTAGRRRPVHDHRI